MHFEKRNCCLTSLAARCLGTALSVRVHSRGFDPSCPQQRRPSCAAQPSRILDSLRSLAGRRPSPSVCDRLLAAGGSNSHKRSCGPYLRDPCDAVLPWLGLMATLATANSDSIGYPTSAVYGRLRLPGRQCHRSQALQPLPALCVSGARHRSRAATPPVLGRRVPPPRLRAALRPAADSRTPPGPKCPHRHGQYVRHFVSVSNSVDLSGMCCICSFLHVWCAIHRKGCFTSLLSG